MPSPGPPPPARVLLSPRLPLFFRPICAGETGFPHTGPAGGVTLALGDGHWSTLLSGCFYPVPAVPTSSIGPVRPEASPRHWEAEPRQPQAGLWMTRGSLVHPVMPRTLSHPQSWPGWRQPHPECSEQGWLWGHLSSGWCVPQSQLCLLSVLPRTLMAAQSPSCLMTPSLSAQSISTCPAPQPWLRGQTQRS